MKKFFRILCFIMASVLTLACFAGCSENTDDPVDQNVSDTTEAEETTEPVDNTIKMFYDDRKTPEELIGKAASSVEFKDQVVESDSIDGSGKDTEVLIYDNATNRIIATGVGTATVVADGVEYPVKVSAAPITIVLITGHSLGEGSQGNATESVVCEAGQVYSTSRLQDIVQKTPAQVVGIGFGEAKRPAGIDALTDERRLQGRPGVAGGLGLEWTRLTGEKIWIVNYAVGGSCINEWVEGSEFHNNALIGLNFVSKIVKKEVAAGHFIYKGTEHVNFSCANFGYKNVSYNDDLLIKWHDSMIKGFENGSTEDIDGDGKIDVPKNIGYVPCWPTKDLEYDEDAPLIYYRAASAEFPNVYMASSLPLLWGTDASVKANFPEIDYTIQSGKTPIRPTTVATANADGVHLTQLGYNAQGQDIARSLYAFTRTENAPEKVEIYNITTNQTGVLVAAPITTIKGRTLQFALVSTPLCSSNYTIEASSHFQISQTFKIKAVEKGEGTVTVKSGDKVVATLNITVK